jgi:putative addiction module CopG family antidote
LLRTALTDVLGHDPDSLSWEEREQLWEKHRGDSGKRVYDRVWFWKTPLYLIAVPSRGVDEAIIAFYSGSIGEDGSQLVEIGRNVAADRPVESLFGSDVTVGPSDKLAVFAEYSLTSLEDPDGHNAVLLTTQDPKGPDFLLREGLCIEPSAKDDDVGARLSLSPDEVRSGERPVLLRLEFTDLFDRWTPLPHGSLAGAILRNPRLCPRGGAARPPPRRGGGKAQPAGARLPRPAARRVRGGVASARCAGRRQSLTRVHVPAHRIERPMATTSLHILLPETLKDFVAERVKQGAFSNPSDYVRALIHADRERQARLETLRSDLKVGADELDRGLGIAGEEVFRRLRERYGVES